MSEIAERWAALRESVPQHTRILLAAKHQAPEAVAAALGAGADLLGHNIVQQLVASEEALASLGAPPHETHIIGHVQRNKARDALTYASCIESVDSVKSVRRLNSVAGTLEEIPELVRERGCWEVFLQINSAGAEGQHGIQPEEAVALADAVANTEHLRLGGLMTMGANTDDESEARRAFALTREIRDALVSAGHPCRELSMGMTADWHLAIDEGSTIIRVGSAVFGPRPAA